MTLLTPGFLWLAAALLLLIASCGCSPAVIRRGLFGMSRTDVEQAADQCAETFSIGTSRCFDLIIEKMDELGATVTQKNKQRMLIVAHGFNKRFRLCIDTTSVGIILNDQGHDAAHIIVTSENNALAEFVSSEVFSYLRAKH